MALRTSAELIELLRRERIFSDPDLERARRLAAGVPLASTLGSALVSLELLTPFQLGALQAGKAGELCVRDYLLLQQIGEGGMGTVYKARHRMMNRLVALKVVRADVLESNQLIKRFEREMQVAAQVDHPNIVRALDAGQDNGSYFYVMEYIAGIDLANLVQEEGQLPIGLACDFARQTALGLQHIHERGLVHRDIKPQNLMAAWSAKKGNPNAFATYDGLKILDLGLAMFQMPDSDGRTMMRLTRVGAAMGTPDFMAPEQTTDAHKVDIRADLYSLGCTLYYLLTADMVFHAGSAAQKLFQHRSAPIPDVRRIRPNVPESLAQVIKTLLAKKPEERYRTPAEAARALSPFCAQTAVAVKGDTATKPITTVTNRKISPATPMPAKGKPPSTETRGNAAPSKPKPPPLRPPVPARQAPMQAAIDKVRPMRWKKWTLGTALLLGVVATGFFLFRDKAGNAETVRAIKVPRPFGHDDAVMFLALSRDGKRLYSGGMDETIKVWDLEAGKDSLTLRGHTGPVTSLVLSPDGKRLFSGSWDNTIKAWDLEAGKETLTLSGHTDRVTSLALSPDEKRLYSGSHDRTIKVWDLETSTEAVPLIGHTAIVTSLALSADGRWLCSGSDDRTIKVWDLETGKETHSLAGHEDIITFLALSSDGKRLYSSSWDRTIKVWDLEAGKEIHALPGHPELIRCLALSADGKRLYSGSQDWTIKVWDLEKRKEAHTLRGHSNLVMSLAMAADDKRLFSCGDDKTIKVWDLETGKEYEPDPDTKKAEVKPSRPPLHTPKSLGGEGPDFRIPTDGLAGRDFIDPISFGPDWLGFNDGNNEGEKQAWRKDGVFAALKTKACLAYPSIPITSYVFEFELEFSNPERLIRICLGDPHSGHHLNTGWDKEKNKATVTLNVWHYGGWGWSGHQEYDLGERVPFKWVVIDGVTALFAHGRLVLREDSQWPADLSLRIWSEFPDSGILHRCAFRPVRHDDLTQFRGVMPESRLTLEPDKTAKRIETTLAGLEVFPLNKNRFLVETTQTPMAWIPSGEFDMGPRDAKEKLLHRVRLTQPFWMSQFEITQKEFTSLMGYNPSRIQGSDYLPVDTVTWEAACEFCSKLTKTEMRKGRVPAEYAYRLPTEAEWEYACRAGSTEDSSLKREDIWLREQSKSRPHEVGEKPANAWQLYDMQGNAQEWCLDAWYDYPSDAKETAVDPFHFGDPKNAAFVVRGGAWWMPAFTDAWKCTWRNQNHSSPANGYRGFRIVLGPTPLVKKE